VLVVTLTAACRDGQLAGLGASCGPTRPCRTGYSCVQSTCQPALAPEGVDAALPADQAARDQAAAPADADSDGPARDAPIVLRMCNPACGPGSGCATTTGTCERAPTEAPLPLRPWNGETTGSPRVEASLRPRFQWRAVLEASSYQLQVDDSCELGSFAKCDFPSPELDARTESNPFRLGKSLPVATSVPVGRRYFWRVRACNAGGCSPWSVVRYLDVGRQAKDFDGDGYADALMMGGEGWRILRGGPTLSRLPDLLVDPQRANGFVSVAAAGDVNGDGFGDIVAGLRTGEGLDFVRLYLGGAPPHLTADQNFHLGTFDEPGAFGTAVTGGGDFDGDGFADIFVGVPAREQTPPRVFLYRGGPTVDAGPKALYRLGFAAGDTTGISLSLAPDLNGDGFPDLIAGTSTGTEIYFGGPSLDPTVDLRPGYRGQVVSGVGDVNGDGFGDFVLVDGTPRLFEGAPALVDPRPRFNLDHDGAAVAGGDIDGDGYSDVVVGVLNDSAFVYWGGAAMKREAGAILGGHITMDGFGSAVAVVGDMNDDGYGEVIVGAPDDSSISFASGRVYVYYGGVPFDGRADRMIDGLGGEDAFGWRLALGGWRRRVGWRWGGLRRATQ
jgi:hypothetical protein